MIPEIIVSAETIDTVLPVGHLVCEDCFPINMSTVITFCGTHGRAVPTGKNGWQECVVCFDLVYSPCPRCGG